MENKEKLIVLFKETIENVNDHTDLYEAIQWNGKYSYGVKIGNWYDGLHGKTIDSVRITLENGSEIDKYQPVIYFNSGDIKEPLTDSEYASLLDLFHSKKESLNQVKQITTKQMIQDRLNYHFNSLVNE